MLNYDSTQINNSIIRNEIFPKLAGKVVNDLAENFPTPVTNPVKAIKGNKDSVVSMIFEKLQHDDKSIYIDEGKTFLLSEETLKFLSNHVFDGVDMMILECFYAICQREGEFNSKGRMIPIDIPVEKLYSEMAGRKIPYKNISKKVIEELQIRCLQLGKIFIASDVTGKYKTDDGEYKFNKKSYLELLDAKPEYISVKNELRQQEYEHDIFVLYKEPQIVLKDENINEQILIADKDLLDTTGYRKREDLEFMALKRYLIKRTFNMKYYLLNHNLIKTGRNNTRYLLSDEKISKLGYERDEIIVLEKLIKELGIFFKNKKAKCDYVDKIEEIFKMLKDKGFIESYEIRKKSGRVDAFKVRPSLKYDEIYR